MKYETRLEMLKLSDIVAAPYNPREDIERGSDEYKALRRSIELNGMVEPPVVNLHNMRCIGGNQRLVVLRDGVERSALLRHRPAGRKQGDEALSCPEPH